MNKTLLMIVIIAAALLTIGCAYPGDDAKPWDVEMGMTQDEVLTLMAGLPRDAVTETDTWALWSYSYWETYWSFGFNEYGRVDYISKW